MLYNVRHVTRFHYSAPILENVMEVRMQPRTDDLQQCLNFQLYVRPSVRIFNYQDSLGNQVHHFNLPGLHAELLIRAEALVKVATPPASQQVLRDEDWRHIDEMPITQEIWEMRAPSRFTEPTHALALLASELDVARRHDPLTALQALNHAIYRSFEYAPKATRVDSPIDEAIRQRRGVCQDYTHIFLALVRNHLRIPCRYVSGYLYHRPDDQSDADATHAWAEVLLPAMGWVGFDPTNDLLAGERHIRVAVGRDYSDVPPTHGIFKGAAESVLSVSVHVRRVEDADPYEQDETISEPLNDPTPPAAYQAQQQQQQ